jgi:hypothetical protein
VFDLLRSSVTLEQCSLDVTAPDISALSLTGSTANLSGSTVLLNAGVAGRAIEVWDSRLSLFDMTFARKPAGDNSDAAIWLDKKSSLLSESGVKTDGFRKYRVQEGKKK